MWKDPEQLRLIEKMFFRYNFFVVYPLIGGFLFRRSLPLSQYSEG